MEIVVGSAVLFVLILLYFTPSVIASVRNHSNRFSIIWLNLFLGWTMLGWLLMLIWACQDPVAPAADTRRTKNCPFCAEKILWEAVFCRFCQKDLPQNG
ncbi:MAG: superinfection immunity protein [Candidatus Omnitrophica bacterium]|nr:superinfection immunity protein [Candidatus Omnitrophota bacterium]